MTITKGLSITIIALFISLMINSCKKEETVEEEAVKAIASFTVDKETGDSPLEVKFINNSTNDVSYNWNFGDGKTSKEKDPVHIFINTSVTNLATFTVTLTISGAGVETANSTCVITVNKSTEQPESTNGKTTAVFNPNLTYGTMTDQDGNIYKTIVIGTQTWLAENFRSTKYNDGSAIPNITTNPEWISLVSGAYCTYNHTTDGASIATYGLLYNWYAINTGKLAPNGWHVCTDAEVTTLTSYLGGLADADGKLKESGGLHWIPPNIATNESGFTFLPAGQYYKGFIDKLEYGMLHTSTAFNSSQNWWYGFDYAYPVIYRGNNGSKNDGLSVRLIKD